MFHVKKKASPRHVMMPTSIICKSRRVTVGSRIPVSPREGNWALFYEQISRPPAGFSLFGPFVLLLVYKSLAVIDIHEVFSLPSPPFLCILRYRKEVIFIGCLEHFAFFPGSMLYES